MQFPVTMLISKELLKERYNVHGGVAISREPGGNLDGEVWYIYKEYKETVLLVRECDALLTGFMPKSEEIN
jgi:hypothetical protein